MDKPTPAWLRDKGHLFRMAGLFAAGIVAFLVLQQLFVPDTFGVYGHYRAAAIDDARDKPLIHAGRKTCGGCHAPQAAVQQTGGHTRLGCEACHGALGSHARNPRSVRVQKPDPKRLCVRCHAGNVARPDTFRQVDVEEHSGGEPCISCHQPHDPKL